MISPQELEKYKTFKKTKLLKHFKDEQNFQQMIEDISPSTFNHYKCWRDDGEKQTIFIQINLIYKLTNILEEDKDQFELIKILEKNEKFVGFLKNSGFIQLLLERNRNISLQDFHPQQYSAQMRNIQILLNSRDFKNWCSKFRNQTNTILSTIKPQRIIQEHQNNFVSNVNPVPASKKPSAPRVLTPQQQTQKVAYLSEVVSQITKQYGKGILEITFLGHLIKFLQDSSYRLSINQIEKLLQKQDKFKNQSLKQKFDDFKKNDIQDDYFYSYDQFNQVVKLMMPLDIYKIKKLDSDLPPQQKAIMVIGGTGVGKSTLILSSLGYQMKKKQVVNKTYFVPSKKLKPQHQSLKASASATSVTKDILSYKLSLNKNTQIPILDTPGFDDTQGKEKDIQNQVNLQNSCKKCQGICFLYLINDIQFNGKGQMFVQLANSISSRFYYSTIEELESMLLLIINKRGNQQDLQILNIPPKARDYHEKFKQKMHPKQRIALEFIVKSLQSKQNFFHPLENRFDIIKQKISKLNFNTQHKIKRNLDHNFVNTVREYNNILEMNIKFNVQKRQVGKARFYYDQITNLSLLIGQQSTKIKKDQIDLQIRKEIQNLENNLRNFILGVVANLKLSQSMFKSYIQELTLVSFYINLLSLKDIETRIYKQINESFSQIIHSIDSSQSNKQKHSNIAQICHYFFSNSILKQQLLTKQKDIQEKCYKNIQVLPKDMEYSYTRIQPQQFDTNYESYQIYYNFYQSFSKLFPQVFKKINKITTPINLKSHYTSKEEIKLEQSKALFNNLTTEFINNNQITETTLLNLNNSYEKCLIFNKSKHLSIEGKLKTHEQSIISTLNQQYSKINNQLQKDLQFQEDYYEKITSYKNLMFKLKIVQRLSKINSIREFVVSVSKNIQEKIKKSTQVFASQLQELTNNINNLQIVIGKTRMLSNISKKIAFYCVFQFENVTFKSLNQKYEKFSQQFTKFTHSLSQSLQQQLRSQNYKSVLKKYKSLVSLQRYQNISQEFSRSINENKNLFKQNITSYIDRLKQILSIRQIRPKHPFEYKRFNRDYCKILVHYVDTILMPFILHLSNDQFVLNKHNQLFLVVKVTLQGICQFVSSLITTNSLQFKKYQQMINQLQNNYQYISITSEIYNIFKQIILNGNVNAYVKNQLSVKFKSLEVTIDLKEVCQDIETFCKIRSEQIQNFIDYSQKKSIKLLEYQNCKRLSLQIKQLKKLDKSIKQANNSDNDSKVLNQFEEKIRQLIFQFQGKTQKRIQKAINLENLYYSNYQCSNLYKQLKKTQDLNNFIDLLERLKAFIYQKIRTLNIYDILSEKSYQQLCQFMQLSAQLHEFIQNQDIKVYNIQFLSKLDQKIGNVIDEVYQEMEKKIQYTLKDMIEQRKFIQVNRAINEMEKYLKRISVFQKKSQTQNVEEFQQKPAFNKIQQIQSSLQQLKNTIKRQKQSDDATIIQPLEGDNKFKAQQIFLLANGKKKHMMRTNIENKIEGLLNKYQNEPYYHTKKIGKVLLDLFEYIPQEIMAVKKYRNLFKRMQKKRIQIQRDSIIDLKNQGYSQKDILTIIIRKYIQFSINQSIQMEEECFKIIKQYLNNIIISFRKEESFLKKLGIVVEHFWTLEYKIYIDSEEKYTTNLQNQFKIMEKEISEYFKNKNHKCIEKYDYIINNDNPQAFDLLEVSNQIVQIYTFYNLFKEKAQKTHFTKEYEQNINFIQKNISKWVKDFQIVCQIQSFEQTFATNQINVNKTKKLLKKLLIKMSLYDLILKSFNSFDIIQINPQSLMEIEQDSNTSTIGTKINKFRLSIDQKIRLIKLQLHNTNFEHYIRFIQVEIQDKLIGLDKLAVQLQLYEQVLSSSNFGYQFETRNYNTGIKSVQKNLNNFIDNFLINLQKAFEIPEQQMPQGLYFLEILLSKIDSNTNKIFQTSQSNERSEMVQKTFSRFTQNPTKQFNRFIQKCLEKLQEKLKYSRKQFCNFDANKLNKEIDKLQKKYNQSKIQAKMDSQSQKQNIKEKNSNMAEEDIQKKLEQAQSLYLQNLRIAQQKYDKKKLDLNKKKQTVQIQIVGNYCLLLLNLKKLQFNFDNTNPVKAKITKIINNQLEIINKDHKKRYLSKKLQEYNFQNYAYLLKSDSKLFKFEYYQQFKHKTEAQNIQYVIRKLKCVSQILEYGFWSAHDQKKLESQKKELLKDYKQFQRYFNELIGEKRQGNIEDKQNKLNQKIENILKQYSNEEDRIKKLAMIMAVWSLDETFKNSDQNQQNQLEEGQDSFFIKPHPVQVAALLLLTRPDINNQIKSQLSQILTGQGKSIVLATLAIYFASKGTNVVVSCYSEYLCQRDFKNFQDLFEKFQVKNLVAYLPFNQICDKVLNNSQLNLKENLQNILRNRQRSWAEAMMSAANNIIKKVVKHFTGKIDKNNSILLIDQVDVFFQKEYFGNTYKPIIKLGDQKCKQFIEYVFKQFERNPKTLIKDLVQSLQFRQLVKIYPKMQKILKNQLYRMKHQYLYPQNQYFVDENMIKYKDGDKLSSKLHYGYETIFNYCRQFQNKKISVQNYEKALFIPIIYGQFAYSQLPKYYKSIIGLSGTIKDLPLSRIRYFRDQYKMTKHNMYILPSIYGDQLNRVIKLVIKEDNQYYKQLISKTKEQIGKGRPVLICFKGYEQLQKFKKSAEVSSSGLMPTYLHQYLDNNLRDKSIKTVGSSKRLTFMTCSFSRGTDFIISDKKVKQNGGLHLILTYIPQKKSQYIQFCGRTARQGQKGSVDVIISKSQASQKSIQYIEQQIETDIFNYMERISFHEKQQSDKKLLVSQANHKLTQENIKNINENIQRYIDFIYKLNEYPQKREKPTKIVIGIDGTISMDRVFVELKRQLKIIMTRIVELGEGNKINGSFEVQVIVYRNYNSGQKILEASDYHQNLQKLSAFLQKIKVNGGMGNQAIELLYRHINIQSDVDMLILIGDAPPNQNKQSIENRKDANWLKFLKTQKSKDVLYSQTNCNQQQKKFNEKLIINGLYINGNTNIKGIQTAESYFTNVSKRHNGGAEQLNFNKPDYSEKMIEFFTTKILAAANNNQNQEEISRLYRDRYRTYTS